MSNNYLQFNGIDQSVQVSNMASNNFGTEDFSLCLWIKTTDISFTIFSKSAGGVWSLASAGSDLSMSVNNAGIWIYTIPLSNINTGEWVHLVVTKKADGTPGDDTGFFFYVNGDGVDRQELFRSGNNPNFTIPSALRIGTNLSNFLDGSLDDIRIYKKELTQGEIDAIYNEGIGTKIIGTEDSLSWGSNCDTGSGNTLFDAIGSVDGTLLNNVSDSMWFSGGLPINLENMPVVNIQGMPLSVSTPDSGGDFNSPGVLNTSYVLNSLIEPEPDYPTSLNWGGVPLSLSLCYDPEISEIDEIGYFYALNVIEILEEVDPDDGSFAAEYTTLSGNRLQISKINNKYYLDIIRIGTSSAPMSKVVLKGMPLGSGGINELVLNRTGFTMDDIDEDPNTGNIDIKQVNIGGVPLSAGRVGFKYYLIVHPVAVP